MLTLVYGLMDLNLNNREKALTDLVKDKQGILIVRNLQLVQKILRKKYLKADQIMTVRKFMKYKGRKKSLFVNSYDYFKTEMHKKKIKLICIRIQEPNKDITL